MGRLTWGTAVLLAIALAGCGGDEETGKPVRPKLPTELAVALAAQSDQIAENLAAGDECAADVQAQALRAQVEAAVGGGEVPRALGREMSAAASSLDDGIVCVPAPPPAPEPKPKPKKEEPVADPCAQLEAEIEQAKVQEEAAQGPDKQMAKELRERLEEQLKFQCEELEGGGSQEGFVPPGQQGGGPGNGNGGGDD